MTYDELRAAIRSAGLRATLQRIAVLRVLSDSATPMSHGEISKLLSAATDDRSTIYRNLIALARGGLIRRTNRGDRTWRFELIRDTPHPHFICTSCGRVSCMPELRVVVRRIKEPHAIRRGEFEVQVRGICDACAEITADRRPLS